MPAALEHAVASRHFCLCAAIRTSPSSALESGERREDQLAQGLFGRAANTHQPSRKIEHSLDIQDHHGTQSDSAADREGGLGHRQVSHFTKSYMFIDEPCSSLHFCTHVASAASQHEPSPNVRLMAVRRYDELCFYSMLRNISSTLYTTNSMSMGADVMN